MKGRERVYIAGPYSGVNDAAVGINVFNATVQAAYVMQRGHLVHCPHTATYALDELLRKSLGDNHPARAYSNWMALDFSIIERWATALYLIAPSPGADLEVNLARSIGIPVWTSLDDVPYVEGWNGTTHEAASD